MRARGQRPARRRPAVYARLIGELRRLGVPAILDTDGEPMRLGLRAEPAVVAPNVDEAEEAVGQEFNDADDYALGLAGLLEMGAGEAVITREAGCVAIVGKGADRRRYEVEIEPLEPISGVGSGDCFLAGYVAARYEGALGSRVPRLRRRLRRRVHPALRRRQPRPERGRAAPAAGRGAGARRPRRGRLIGRRKTQGPT